MTGKRSRRAKQPAKPNTNDVENDDKRKQPRRAQTPSKHPLPAEEDTELDTMLASGLNEQSFSKPEEEEESSDDNEDSPEAGDKNNDA